MTKSQALRAIRSASTSLLGELELGRVAEANLSNALAQKYVVTTDGVPLGATSERPGQSNG